MSFLSDLAAKYSYRELRNVIGYSFAIQSCMLSGKYPDETNHWLPYFYSPQKSPFLFKTMNKVERLFPLDKSPPLRHLALAQARKLFLKKGAHVNNVPLNVIDQIALYPYYYMCELPFFQELREVLLEKRGAALAYVGPPKIRRNIYGYTMKYIKSLDWERGLIVVYDDMLDGLGHRYGPYSNECLRYARVLDRVLLAMYKKLRSLFRENLTFAVFSDHGQCEQKSCVDILARLCENALKLGDDYSCFIDATLALFWARDESVKEKLLNTLNRIKSGKLLSEDLQKRYHIKFDNNRYGEIVFVLKPGGTFFPNFFSAFGTMRGLHGYLPEEEVQKGFLISDKEIPANIKHVKDFKGLSLGLFPRG